MKPDKQLIDPGYLLHSNYHTQHKKKKYISPAMKFPKGKKKAKPGGKNSGERKRELAFNVF